MSVNIFNSLKYFQLKSAKSKMQSLKFNPNCVLRQTKLARSVRKSATMATLCSCAWWCAYICMGVCECGGADSMRTLERSGNWEVAKNTRGSACDLLFSSVSSPDPRSRRIPRQATSWFPYDQAAWTGITHVHWCARLHTLRWDVFECVLLISIGILGIRLGCKSEGWEGEDVACCCVAAPADYQSPITWD